MADQAHVHHLLIERYEQREDVIHDLGFVQGWAVPRTGDVIVIPGVEVELHVGRSRWDLTEPGLIQVRTSVRPLL